MPLKTAILDKRQFVNMQKEDQPCFELFEFSFGNFDKNTTIF